MLEPRSSDKKHRLIQLYREGIPFSDIASEIGGTYAGIRSTVRKMRERGELPPRMRPGRR